MECTRTASVPECHTVLLRLQKDSHASHMQTEFRHVEAYNEAICMVAVHADANITCEVSHIMYIVAKVLQVSVQDIKRYVHPRMSYVSPAMANNAIRSALPVPSQKLYAVPPETHSNMHKLNSALQGDG